MTQHPFTRETDESLVLVQCRFPNHGMALALDTGASHTTIDLAAIIIAGYEIADAIGTVQLETASGLIEAYLFEVRDFFALGSIRNEMTICAYDFFAHHALTDFDGVLGLDFLQITKSALTFGIV